MGKEFRGYFHHFKNGSQQMTSLDDLEPPERPDFRRVAKGVPYVVGTDGKRARYRRSSSAGKILDDEGGLVDWQKRTIIAGAAQRPDLMAVVSTLDHDQDKKAIRDIVEECLVSGKGTQRATTGTAIHRMLDRIDSGDDWTPAPQFADAVNAYVNAMDAYGFVVVDIECHCINDTYRLAGTMDRRYRTTRQLVTPTGEILPIGSVLAGDTKTGRSLEYASGSYTTQLAAYASSMRYDVVTDERTSFDPPSNQEWAIIVHVSADDGRCDIYWVDLQAGMEALNLAECVRQWRARTDLISPARAPLHAVRVATPVDAPEAPVVTDAADTADRAASEVLAAVRAWLRERVALVRARGDDAVSDLQRLWPAGAPGLKFDTQTETQLDDINDALWKVEALWGITFPSSDPRTERHWSDRWARPIPGDEPPAESIYLLRQAIESHSRTKLYQEWSAIATADSDPLIKNRFALAHALLEFASLDLNDWADEDVTEMLDGTLRAFGYARGIGDLGYVTDEYAPLIMSSAFAITAGTALLLYDKDGKPVVRNITSN